MGDVADSSCDFICFLLKGDKIFGASEVDEFDVDVIILRVKLLN
jgi:hypothetical protein